MKNVARVYAEGMPHGAVIQAAFAIPVPERCTLTMQERSALYATLKKNLKMKFCHFYFVWSEVTTSASVEKELSLQARTRIRIFG